MKRKPTQTAEAREAAAFIDGAGLPAEYRARVTAAVARLVATFAVLSGGVDKPRRPRLVWSRPAERQEA